MKLQDLAELPCPELDRLLESFARRLIRQVRADLSDLADDPDQRHPSYQRAAGNDVRPGRRRRRHPDP